MTTACANRTILHATPTLLATGGEAIHSLAQLCNAICRVTDGAQLALICRDLGSKSQVQIVNDVQILKVGVQQSFNKELRTFQPKAPLALVHQHGIWQQPMREVAAFARSKRLPLVISVQGMLQPAVLRHRPLQKKIDMFLYQRRDLKHAAAFHATTEIEVAQIRAQGLKQPIFFIPNGIPLPQIELAAGHDENKKERSALCMARVHQTEALENLLRSWAELKPQGWRLRIVGSDNTTQQARLQKLAVELGIDASVEISGILFGLAHQYAYRSADLFVLPSIGEPFDGVAAEALAYGLPLISRVGTFTDEPEREGCGWHAANPEAVTEALRQAMALSVAERATMGQKARALIERRYYWPSIGRTMLSCYSWLLGETSVRPDCVIQ